MTPSLPCPAPLRLRPVSYSGFRTVVSIFALTPLAVLPPHLRAELPTGAQVTQGNVAISQAGGRMTIDQTSRQAIVNWQSFNIGAENSVRLQQSGADAAMLARVTGGDPSKLLGSLQADGKLFLINSKGILVGAGATIDTAGFVGSTLDVSDTDFLRGTNLVFKGDSSAGIVNLGRLSAREGSVLLFAHTVKNVGEIAAPKGTAGLAAGTEVQLASADDPTFTIKLNLPATTEKTGVENSGVVSAAQARLEAAGGSLYELAVNQSGVVRATGTETKNGRILLTASGGTVGVSGTVSARNSDGSGGEILVGGDYQGANAAVANATRTVVTAMGKLDASADATQPSAAAGRAIVWADDATRFLGTIDTRGSGGGFVEVSGKHWLDFNPNAPVQVGAGGTLLLDPDALVISSAASGNTTTSGTNPFTFGLLTEPATLNVTTLQNQLALSNVTLNTSTSGGDITVNSPITWSNNNTLRLQAGGSINLNANITGGAASTLALYAGLWTTSTIPGELGGVSLRPQASLASDATIQVGKLVYGANAASNVADQIVDTPAFTGAAFFDGNLSVGTLEVDLSGGGAGVVTHGSNNSIGTFRASGPGDLQTADVVDHQGGLDVHLLSVTSSSPYLTFEAAGTLTLLSGSQLSFSSPGTVALASRGGAFINQAGSAAFGANVRYLIYTSTAAATTRGGLTPSYVFNQTYDPNNSPYDSDTVSRIIYSGAQPTLTFTADGKTRVYGDGNPTFTATVSGLLDGDTLATATTGSVSLATSATALSDVGNYGITASAGTVASSFYSLGFTGGSLSVTPAPLTIAVDNKSRTYGDANPTYTATFTGLKNSESVGSAGTLALSSVATQSSNVSAYPITGSLTGANPNYTATITLGSLTVNKAPLTVAVSTAITKNQGDANPNFASFTTASGLKLLDTLATAVPDLAFTTAANTGSAAGIFPVSATGTSGNYALTFTPGQLTIASVALPILTYAANNVARVYGDANPAFGFTRSGLVMGVTDDVTGLPSFSTTATQLSGVGAYQINLTPGTLASSHYQFSFVPGTLTVTAAPLTVTVGNTTRVYGDANPTFTTQVTGLKNTDAATAAGTFNASTPATLTSNVGSYSVGGTLTGGSTNYTATVVPGTLTVGQASLTATIANASRPPNTANPTFTATYAGFKNGDTTSVISGLTLSTTATLSSGTGSYPITGTGSATNYNLTFVPGVLSIGSILNYRADSFTRSYGASNPALTYSVTGLLAGDTLASVVTGSPALSTTATQSSGVGSYTIGIVQGTLNSSTYGFSFTPGSLTIDRAPLTISASSASRTYGASNPVFSATYTGLVNGDTSTVVSGLLFSNSASATSNVGTYVINPFGATASNYAITYQPGTLTIDPARLTVAVANASRIYGDANPTFSGSVTGLVNGDTATSLGINYSTTATAASPVSGGGYPITASFGGSSNYVLQSLIPGSLTITPAPLTVKMNDQTRRYGDADPALTYSVTGLKNGDAAASAVHVDFTGTTASATSGIGSYGILGTATPLSFNYTIGTFQRGSLTITPRPLTITADSLSRTYGSVNPALTATFSGLASFDSAALFGNLGLTTSATAASNAGEWGITFNALSNPNYTVTRQSGTLTITPVPLTLTAASLSRTYGSANPAFTYNVSGLVNGDAAPAAFSGTPTFTTLATSNSGVGTYAIDLITGSLVSTNYTFRFAPGTLSILRAPLTLVANGISRTYGSANPALTYSVNGFVAGDTAATALTGTPVLSTSATPSSVVGTYAINLGAGSIASANYDLSFANSALSITPAVLTLSASSPFKTYGNANPALTYSVSGYVNGDSAATAFTGAPVLSTSATSGSGVGSYAIDLGRGSLASTNYDLRFVPGTLSIQRATLNASIASITRIYGTANPSFSLSGISGLVNGDTAAVLSDPVFFTSATASSAPGSYSIVGVSSAANYIVSIATGSLTIDRAPFYVTAGNASAVIGSVPASFSLSGVPVPIAGGPQFAVGATTTATNTSTNGFYPITPAITRTDGQSVDDLSRYYDVRLTAGTLKLTVPGATNPLTTYDPSQLGGLNTLNTNPGNNTINPNTTITPKETVVVKSTTPITVSANPELPFDTAPLTNAQYATYLGSFTAEMAGIKSTFARTYEAFVAGKGVAGSAYETMDPAGRAMLADWMAGRLSDDALRALIAAGDPGALAIFGMILPALVDKTRDKALADLTPLDRQVLGRLADLTEQRRADTVRIAQQKYDEMVAKQQANSNRLNTLFIGPGDFDNIVNGANEEAMANYLAATIPIGTVTGASAALLALPAISNVIFPNSAATGIAAGGPAIAAMMMVVLAIRGVQMNESIKNEAAFNALMQSWKPGTQLTAIKDIQSPQMDHDMNLSVLMLATELIKSKP